ncbi:MAG: hypothetical protein IPI46_14075 [Bacteroidetes bacterium]|nr:hypothetical protein [Bacteroidota bacterium]
MAIQLPSPITLTALQDTAIKTAINTVITTGLAVASVDLDTEAKKRLNTIDNIRWPFALRTMTIHVNNFATVLPGFMSLADAKTNFDSVTRIREQKALLYKAIENLDELSMVAENNVYEYMIAMYDIAQRAQAAGTVPGIQSFIDDIAPLFAQTPVESVPAANP